MNGTRMQTTIALLAVAMAFTFSTAAPAASTGTKFAAPEKAVDAFVTALRSNDLPTLLSIFGNDSKRLFVSEDPVADQNVRNDFLQRYDAAHHLAEAPDGARVLLVGKGAEEWPLPIPLVKSAAGWFFDTARGFEEIINRRIGRNELDAIQTCLAIVDAQHDYYSKDRDGNGVLEYAQKFRSTPGKHDGLFWPAAPGEPQSPLGEFVATAADEGYTAASNAYHGYHYKLLTAQGPSAPGGAYDYLAHGMQIGGFAALAYPAAYGDSGIMTFIVSHSGVVYQRDLGPSTEKEVAKITTFDPGHGWTKVSDKDLQLP